MLLVIIGVFVLILGFLYWKVNGLSSNQSGTKTFSFVLENSQYVPDTIRVNLGDTVVFNIVNKDNEEHGLHLPEFGVAEGIPALQQTSVQFIANKVGTSVTSCATDHPEKINVIVES